jgi:YegS/Rv2252/BmrU family lipid kinase
MGIVPLGTFNDLARTLGIPFDIGGACSVISDGRTRTIDVARVNDAYYLNEASIGISSRVARLQTTRDKQRLGILAIVKSVLVGVRYLRPFHAQIEFDGNRIAIESVQLTVANSNRFGGLINIEDAAIDDGWLDLYSIRIDRPTWIFSVVAALLAGKRHRAAGLSAYRSAAFTVTTRRPHRITADGEPAGTTPARFEILPRSLHVFAPAAPSD